MPSSDKGVSVTWHTTPPTPAQLAAWRQLWARLLGHVEPAPETRQPQEDTPGASNDTAVISGSPRRKHAHDSHG
jgi:hypothetical protein